MRKRTNNLWRRHQRPAAIAVALFFILLGIIAPAFHTHSGEKMLSSPQTVSILHHAGATSAAFHALKALANDDCALCQWLTGAIGAAAVSIILLLTAASYSALLLLAARLAALCARPAPRRGLRAPPVFAYAA